MKLLHKISVIALISAMPMMAADLPVITLEQAIDSAKENNISIELARVTLNQSIRNADNAMRTFMPDIRLNAGLQAGGNFPPVTTSPEYTGLTLNAGASVSFPFTGSMIRDGEYRAAQRESAMLTFQNEYNTIEFSVIAAYWGIAAASIQAESARALAEDAERQYASAMEMYESGIADELSLNQNELAYNQALLTVKTAEDTLENSKDDLRTLTGFDGDFTISPLPSAVFLSFPSYDKVFDEYSENSLAVRRSRNNLESARTELERTRLDSYVPSITADLSYSYRGGWNDSWSYGSTTNGLTGGITVALPIGTILPGGSQDSAIKDAEDLVTSSSLALMQSRDDLLSEIRSSITRIRQYQDNMEIAAKSVSSAERTYELVNEAYEAGITTASELANARTDVLTARYEAIGYDISHLLECYSLAYMLNISIDELQAEFGTGELS